MKASEILKLFGEYGFNFSSEADLHEGIAQMFQAEGIEFVREWKLNDRDRIDFMVGSIGIEVKIKESFGKVARQLGRYAECEQISELILVTSRVHHRMPEELGGKPLTTIQLAIGRL